MTGKQYKRALAKVGLSIGKAGNFLGYTRRQSFRIAADEATIPEGARKLLLIMLAVGVSAEQVDQLVAGEPIVPDRLGDIFLHPVKP